MTDIVFLRRSELRSLADQAAHDARMRALDETIDIPSPLRPPPRRVK